MSFLISERGSVLLDLLMEVPLAWIIQHACLFDLKRFPLSPELKQDFSECIAIDGARWFDVDSQF